MNNILVVDIGGTNIKLGFSLGGIPQSEVRLFPSNELRRRDPVVSLAEMTRTYMAETKLVPDTIVSTVPGFVGADGDRILFAANMPELNHRRLASDWAELVGMPVILERDAVLSLIGEHLAGAAREADTVLGMFFGTGVGAAFLEKGRPFRGAGWALEVGHMPFKGQGTKVDTSRSACLEGYVSGRVLQAIADLHGIPIESLFTLRSDNHALTRELELFVRDQAAAVAMTVAMFSPQVVLIGGGICEMSGFPKEQLASLIENSFPFAHTGRAMDLRWATLGWQSVLHGAPRAVRERRRG